MIQSATINPFFLESVSDAPNKDGAISVLDPSDEVSKRFVEIIEDIKKEFLE